MATGSSHGASPVTSPGQFNTPHSIASDANNNIYVADRGNGRIQVFDTEGKFLRQIRVDVPFPADTRPVIGNRPGPGVKGTFAPGSPWAICITPPPNQVLYASDAYPGRIYKLSLDGKVLGVLGDREGSSSNSDGFTKSLVPLKMNSMSANC